MEAPASPFQGEPLSNTADRLTQWKNEEERFRRIVDGIGRHIDEGVLDTVVVLNLLDLKTIQSCEGHLDHGTYAPYIDVRCDVDEALRVAYEANGERIRTSLHLPRSEQDESLFEKQRELGDKITEINLAPVSKLVSYLGEFYSARNVPYDVRICCQSFPLGWTRLESQGAFLQLIQPDNLKQQRLLSYQQEMTDFTAFLKEKYFTPPTSA